MLRTIEELKATSKKGFVPAFHFALVYAALEDKDQAFMWLEKVMTSALLVLPILNWKRSGTRCVPMTVSMT